MNGRLQQAILARHPTAGLVDVDDGAGYVAMRGKPGLHRIRFWTGAGGDLQLGEPEPLRPRSKPGETTSMNRTTSALRVAQDAQDISGALLDALHDAFPGEGIEIIVHDDSHVIYRASGGLLASSFEMDSPNAVVSAPAWPQRRPRAQGDPTSREVELGELQRKVDALMREVDRLPARRPALRRGPSDADFAPCPPPAFGGWQAPPIYRPMMAEPETGARLHHLAGLGGDDDFAPIPPDRWA
jgi:hypothetical protein